MKALHELDARAAEELVAMHNPTPDDTDILMETLQCLNLAPISFASPVSATRQ